MDIHRAKQIIASPKEIDVTYHGVSVWMKNCNEQNQSVSIYEKTNPENVNVVPAAELQEQG
jgi:small acid-soluble spore protein H (minor)